ncbi:MAG TPA: FAD-linked oxidase C-terminal domain-containing protein [Pyrinomonadaceae bacterium]
MESAVGTHAVLSHEDELLVYECDGLPQHKYRPHAVAFPSSTEETAAVMKVLTQARVPFTPRGAGTGLSGGALALNKGVVIELARMRRILKIDEINRTALVQTGVVNLHVSRAVAHLGLHYVPDPSSQPTCTIGGNIAENAGGIHCLKYGTTTDHVLGLRVVLAGGEVVQLGGAGTEQPGYDLLGIFIGSEGTFGIATEATLRLTPIPPVVRTLLADFPEVNDASHAVSAIIAAGVMPAALEMMDHEIISAVEASVFAAGLPLDAGAALLIELDGIEAGIDDEADRVKSICLQYGARSCRLAQDENERKKLWAARKGAFGAIGRISPDSMIQDAVVPRSRLPEVLASAYRIAARNQLRIANVFHAGDGNLHPLICFDSRFPDEVHRVKEAGRELMETCVRVGGSITGEHGVGFDKRELLPLIFSEADMDAMLRVRAAFDPTGLCNPGKIIPMLRGCGEARAVSEPGALAKGSPVAEAPHSKPGSLTSQKDVLDHVPERHGESVQTSGVQFANTAAGQVGVRVPFDPNVATQQLARVVGNENVNVSTNLQFSPPPLVVTPGSITEVCEVMKLASSEGWAVVPAGAMTWLNAGNTLERAHVVLSTRRLNRIIEHEPADLVAVTEAGVTLRDFNEALAQNGQWLPLDPPDEVDQNPSTIGGVVATGQGGAQQFGYGAPRRHVIGMKVVLADGSLIKVGGRVVKNVAGYDLSKLFTGSYGTLGVIVEVNFKLRPLPFETKTTMAWGSRNDLLAGARGVIDSRLFPVAVELLSPKLAYEAQWSEGMDHLLLIRFAGYSSAVREQTRITGELLKEKGATKSGPLVASDRVVWKTLAALPSRFSIDLVWRAGLQPSDIESFLARVEEGPAIESGFESMWQAAVGDGRIRVVDRFRREDNETENVRRASLNRIEKLRLTAQSFGGALIVEHSPDEIKAHADAWGSFGTSAGLMQRIKQQLDPDGIFSPGRFDFTNG